MSNSWAISGVDLHLPPLGRGARAGLERALREAVRDGRLHPGARLPSSRALAADLGVARNTVAEAYTQLVAEGWLAARQGSGTRVAERPGPTATRASETSVTESGEAGPVPRGASRFDLRAGVPALSEFPRVQWLAAARRAVARAPHDALGYGDPRGRPELRAALAGYLSRARGVVVQPDTVVVCAGYAHGLSVLAETLRRGGETGIGVERYGHPAHRSLLSAAGLRVHPLPVDGGGADLAALTGAPDRSMAGAILTPAHQFPLGVTLAADRRAAAVRWARGQDALIIEDDYDGEYRYDRQPVGALQALDPDHVVYAGTASKSLAPGLRLSWLVLPPRLVAAVVGGHVLRDRCPPALDQLTLAEFIDTGRYDRQVRRTRVIYRRRRDTLVAALGREIPAVHVTGIAAGMHAVLRLPDGVPEAAAVRAAARHGVLVEGLSRYRATPADGDPPALLVGYGTPASHAFTAAIARLCAALASVLARP